MDLMPRSAPSRKSRARRLALRAVLVLTALLGIAYLLRGPLFGTYVATQITDALSAQLGGSYSIRSVEGGWISDVVVVGLRTETPPAAGSLREIAFERARVEFSWGGLLDDPARAVRGVAIDGLRVVLDTSRDAAGAPGTSENVLGDVLAALPRPLPRLDVRGTVLVTTPGGEWRVGDLRIDGGGTALRIAMGDITLPLEGVEGPARLRGSIDWSDARVVRWTSDDEVGGVRLAEVTATSAEGAGSRLDARISVAGGTVDALLSGEGFEGKGTALDLAKIPAWIRAFAPDRLLPRTGMVDARFDGDDAAIHVVLSATGVGWADRTVERLVGDVTWRDGRLAVTELDVIGEGVTASARDVVLDPSAPLLVVQAGEFRASTADVGALAARLGLPDVVARLPAAPCSAAIRLHSASAGRLDVEALTFDAGTSRGSASGTASLPEDPVAWRSTDLRLDVRVTAALDDIRRALPPEWMPPDCAGAVGIVARIEGELARPRVSGQIDGADLRFGGQQVDRIAVTAKYEAGVLTATDLVLAAPFADIRAHGAVSLDDRAVHDARVELASSDLAAATLAFPALPRLEGELTATASISGDARNGWKGDVAAKASRLVARGWEIGTFDVAGRIDGALATVDRLAVDGPLGSLVAQGHFDVASGAFDVPLLSAKILDLRTVTSRVGGAPEAAGALEISGSVRRAASAPWRAVEGTAHGIGTGLEVEGVTIARLEFVADARDGRVDVKSLDARGDAGTIHLAATIVPGDAGVRGTLRELLIERGERTATLLRPVAIAWSPGTLDVGEFEAVSSGVGQIRGYARADGDVVRASLDVVDVDLSLLSDRAAGLATGHLEVSGSPRAPDLRLVIDAPRISWEGESVSASAALSQDARGVHLEHFAVDARDSLHVDGSGFLPIRLGGEGLTTPDAPTPASLRLRLRSALPQTWSRLVTDEPFAAESIDVSIDGAGSDLAVRASVRELRWTGAGGGPAGLAGDTLLRIDVGKSGTTVHLESAATGPVTVRGDLRSPFAPDWTRPTAAAAEMRNAPLDGTLLLDLADLAAVTTWAPELRRLTGRVHGRLTVGGTVSAPRWTGELEAEDVSLLLPGDVAPIDRGTAHLRLERDRLVIEKLTGRLGHGPVSVTGEVDFGGEPPARLDVRLVGENVLLVRSHHLRLRADVDVRVTGELDAPSIAGSARVTRGLYTRPMDILGRGSASADQSFQLFSLRGSPFARARLDLVVAADRTIRVENDLIDADVSLDLRLRGTGEVPEPVGSMTFHGANITLPFTDLEVERGVLEFSPGSPFTPRVRAVATAAVKGYDLDVVVSGSFPGVQVHVASSPPLSQTSARLLLATGATPTELEREGIAGAALTRAGALLGGAALSFLGAPAGGRGDSVLNRVRVEFGREESDEGLKTVTAEFRLAERWYLVTERDRYEDYNMGIVWRLRFQ